jgi:hypothetical protein
VDATELHAPRNIWHTANKAIQNDMGKIRQKTRELHAKTRRALLGGLTVSLLVIGISGYGIASADVPVVRAASVFAGA